MLNAYRKDDGLPALPPRWQHGEPVLVELEVPREWCLWRPGVGGPRARLDAAWEARNPAVMLDEQGTPYAGLEAMLDDMMAACEVRLDRPVPPGMIRSITACGPGRPG